MLCYAKGKDFVKIYRVKNSQTVAQILENKFVHVVEKSSDFLLGLFGFVKATKFRDLSEFSECVQSVLAELSPLSMFICKPKYAARGKA